MVRAKMRTVAALQLDDAVEDILITLTGHYHLIRLPGDADGAHNRFLYLVLDRSRANLALTRHHRKRIEASLEV